MKSCDDCDPSIHIDYFHQSHDVAGIFDFPYRAYSIRKKTDAHMFCVDVVAADAINLIFGHW